MGNCQAAEAATVVIVHPGNKIDRIYWSVSATHVMNANAGHYVAQVVASSAKSEDGQPLKQLKLLRPDDTLHIGQVYRLITFEDVLKEFSSKKCMKLGKLLKETGGISRKEKRKKRNDSKDGDNSNSVKVEQEVRVAESSSSSARGIVGRQQYYQGGGQWRPALQSIAEVGS